MKHNNNKNEKTISLSLSQAYKLQQLYPNEKLDCVVCRIILERSSQSNNQSI
jgi:hypothetical protein